MFYCVFKISLKGVFKGFLFFFWCVFFLRCVGVLFCSFGMFGCFWEILGFCGRFVGVFFDCCVFTVFFGRFSWRNGFQMFLWDVLICLYWIFWALGLLVVVRMLFGTSLASSDLWMFGKSEISNDSCFFLFQDRFGLSLGCWFRALRALFYNP